jgi:hypothetical protein
MTSVSGSYECQSENKKDSISQERISCSSLTLFQPDTVHFFTGIWGTYYRGP